jgi:DNA-binding MarR family transcriptional regulator
VTELITDLDEVVHQRARLGILTVVHEGRKVEFGYLQETLGLTAGNLGQHLSVLEKSGFVHIEKGYEGRRARTWVSNTRSGTKALQAEIRALTEIVARVEMADLAAAGPADSAIAADRHVTDVAPSSR